MTRDSGIRAVAWTVALVAAGLAALSWVSAMPMPDAERTPPILAFAPPDSVKFSSKADEREALFIAARNPFRVARTPTHVRFGSEPMPDVTATEPERDMNRPILRLAGIVGGPPWTVLIVGVPGHESGLILAQSEEIAGVLFRGIRGDTVILETLDTILHLTPTSGWQ